MNGKRFTLACCAISLVSAGTALAGARLLVAEVVEGAFNGVSGLIRPDYRANS